MTDLIKWIAYDNLSLLLRKMHDEIKFNITKILYDQSGSNNRTEVDSEYSFDLQKIKKFC